MVAHFFEDDDAVQSLGLMDGLMAEEATQLALQRMQFDPGEAVVAHGKVDARVALKLVN